MFVNANNIKKKMFLSKMKPTFYGQNNFSMHLSIFEVPKTKGVNTSELLCNTDVPCY
jgi:hypothetical protein